MSFRLLSLLVAAGLLLSSVHAGVAAPPPAGPTDPILMGVDELTKNVAGADYLQPRWSRITFSWADVQPNEGDFSNLGETIDGNALQHEVANGTRLAGMIEFTPPWAQQNPGDGQRSVPKNLYLPYDDPNNAWGQFVYNLAKYYQGTVDEWIIWNEPEFRPGDPGAGGSFTWLGSDQDFAQLLKVAYLAAKKANPNAIVTFPGTSYWVEELATPSRPQFYQRILALLQADPDREANHWYHDAVALNLYHSPDTIYRVATLFKQIQQGFGIDRPLWLTETNAMPTDDTLAPCPHSENVPQVRMNDPYGEHAAFGVQAMAMAAASGYQRASYYQLTDSNVCQQPAVWGVYRDDGSPRPIRESLKTAFSLFHGFTNAQFVPLVRPTQAWSPWPNDPASYLPNWQIYQVALDKPDGSRVSVLWNGDGEDHVVRVPVRGPALHLYDKAGNEVPITRTADGTFYLLTLPAATAHGEVNIDGVVSGDPPGYHFLGGSPLILVEGSVGNQPVTPPVLDNAPDFQLTVSPSDGLIANLGNPTAQFTGQVIGRQGFADAVNLSVLEWSSQRLPEPKDPSSLPLKLTFLDGSGNPVTSIPPGQTFTVSFDTSGTPEPGIYFVTIQGAAPGGITHTAKLMLVLT